MITILILIMIIMIISLLSEHLTTHWVAPKLDCVDDHYLDHYDYHIDHDDYHFLLSQFVERTSDHPNWIL